MGGTSSGAIDRYLDYGNKAKVSMGDLIKDIVRYLDYGNTAKVDTPFTL